MPPGSTRKGRGVKTTPKKTPVSASWSQKYGPGSTNLGVYKPGSTKAIPNRPPDQRDYAAELGNWWANQGGPQPPTTRGMGAMYGGGNGGGGRGGGGGGGGGPSAAQLAAVNQAFTLNEAPYWHMQAALDNQRRQAEAYNPDFGAMQQTALATGQRAGAERDALIAQQQAGLTQLGQTLANQAGTGIANAARDLGAQGFNAAPYVEQANQLGAARTGQLGNMAQYLAMLNMNAASGTADWQQGLGMIRQGGESALANSRGQLYNNLDMQAAQIQQQAAQARLANEQAKLQFMIQNGLIG